MLSEEAVEKSWNRAKYTLCKIADEKTDDTIEFCSLREQKMPKGRNGVLVGHQETVKPKQ